MFFLYYEFYAAGSNEIATAEQLFTMSYPQGLPILGENTHTYLIMYEWATTNRTQVGSDGKGTGVFIEKIPIIYQNFP